MVLTRWRTVLPGLFLIGCIGCVWVSEVAAKTDSTLSSVGSDTLQNVMELWADEYRHRHPNVNFQIQSIGSSTAPVALIEGTAQLGPMSRAMRQTELQQFAKRFGYQPTAVPVAIDLLAVYVHPDNPLEQLSLAQLDALFSINRRCGAPTDIQRWGQLGLTGRWQQRFITLYSRNAVSGTYGYFKQHVLCNGDIKARTNQLAGSSAMLRAISQSPGGIGYSGIGYATRDVKVLALASDDGPAFSPTADNALNGNYPLARQLYIYVNRAPGQALTANQYAFFDLVLSAAGQQIVLQDGFLPLPAAVIAQWRQTLGLPALPELP
ncbi:MAG: phosphate ABC transporter substrate-binding protein [Rheinheimera sp.]|uniref:PstS family phosphate ABC transporter substrate-binding protein n=1 Tax=Arsukibacterium sp. UBA3155 TaxID=1946058 RepID=UPI000C8F3AB1|nr:phosphate ABC transporter substrate-binding protein [Arsukibacterium sp. UBA3155]MAD75440.1 phosphate ABC transporter substrate-binding protein [Rheinheimera sp.]|tara:strand:+ start:54789 stop:55754 length:966 start_codon:yes stop_codon:yes gene_type:complete